MRITQAADRSWMQLDFRLNERGRSAIRRIRGGNTGRCGPPRQSPPCVRNTKVSRYPAFHGRTIKAGS